MVFKIIDNLEQWNTLYPKFHLDRFENKTGELPWLYAGIYKDKSFKEVIGSISTKDNIEFKDGKEQHYLERINYERLDHLRISLLFSRLFVQNKGQFTLDFMNTGYTIGTGMGTEVVNPENPIAVEKDCENCEYKNHICEPQKDCENCEYRNHVCESNETGTGNSGNNGNGNNNGTSNGDNETPIEFEKIGKFWEDNFIRAKANLDIGKKWENNLIRTVNVDANIGKMWEENIIFIEEEEE
jgi:hypothetical protein